jgi:dual specificity protein phosphatase-like protein
MDQIDRLLAEEAQGILDISWVGERIAVGGWVETDEKMRAAAKCGITHIIDMTWECDDTPLAKPYGIEVLVNAVDDDFQPKPPEVLEKGVEFALTALRKPDSKLLIHCVAGRHRGPMMALAVFCTLGWPIEDAMRLLSERRPVVDWAPVYVDSVRNFLGKGGSSKSERGELSESTTGPLACGRDEGPTENRQS